MPRNDPNAVDLISCALISPTSNNKSNSASAADTGCGVGGRKSKDKLENTNNNIGNNPASALQLQTVIQVESPASSTNSRKSFQFCRICHDGDGNYSNASPNSTSSTSTGLRESLIAPCKCTGTVALIHLSCLEHWLTASNTDRCEICQYVYRTTRVPRTCNEYLRDRSNQFNVRNLIADIVCFMLLTPLLIVSTYLCVLGANQYFIKERWEAAGLIILSLFLLGVYFTWCHVTIKYHSSVWRSWQTTNQQVRVALEERQQYQE